MTVLVAVNSPLSLPKEAIDRLAEHRSGRSRATGDGQQKPSSFAEWLAVLSTDDALFLLPVLEFFELPSELQQGVAQALVRRARDAVGASQTRGRRWFLSYARRDGTLADRIETTLAAGGDHVFRDERIKGGSKWELELLRELAAADGVYVALGDDARHSAWVEAEVKFATALQRMRAGGEDFRNDRAPRICWQSNVADVPPWLASVQGRVDGHSGRIPIVVLTLTVLLACVVFLGLAPTLAWLIWPLLALGVALSMSHWLSTWHRYAFASGLARSGRWLAEATATDVLKTSHWFFGKIYGKRILSLRGVLASIAISALLSAPVLFLPYINIGAPGVPILAVSLLGVTVAFDFVSLVVTRLIVSALVARKSVLVSYMTVAIAIDLLTACVVVLVPLLLVGWPPEWVIEAGHSHHTVGRGFGDLLQSQTGRWQTWLEVNWVSLVNLAAGQYNLENLTRSGVPTIFLITALWAGTGALPSLVHLAVSASVLFFRVFRGRPMKTVGRLLAAWARHDTGPAAAAFGVAGAIALLIVVRGVVSGYDVFEAELAGSRARERPRFARFVTSGASRDPENMLGAGRRSSRHDPSLCVRTDELTQQEWKDVVTDSELADRLGLLAEPSVFHGMQRPVESVTICESMRLLNVWSHQLERVPVYCEFDASARECESLFFDASRRWDARFELRGCETGGGVMWVPWADGLFLQEITPRERRRTRLDVVGWDLMDSRQQTHEVGTHPDESHLVFRDRGGNVSEMYVGMPGDGVMQFRIRGRSWLNTNSFGFSSGNLTEGMLRSFRSSTLGLRPAFRESDGDCDLERPGRLFACGRGHDGFLMVPSFEEAEALCEEIDHASWAIPVTAPPENAPSMVKSAGRQCSNGDHCDLARDIGKETLAPWLRRGPAEFRKRKDEGAFVGFEVSLYGSPYSHARGMGLVDGDVVVQIDGELPASMFEMTDRLASRLEAGRPFVLTIQRNNELITREFTFR